MENNYCATCGKITDLLSPEGKFLCSTCKQKATMVCTVCGKEFLDLYKERSIIHTLEDKCLCEECLAKEAERYDGKEKIQCQHCGEISFLTPELCKHDARCAACAVPYAGHRGEELKLKEGPFCHICGRRNNLDKSTNGIYFCEECVADAGECQECGEQHPLRGSVRHRHKDRRKLCPDCAKGYPVMPHNWVIEPAPLDKGNLYFGFENEIDFRSQERAEPLVDIIRAWAWDQEGRFAVVHDGSLAHGVELVSRPATLDYWRNLPPYKLYPPVKPDMTGCSGGHVHMSRTAFTAGHLIRFCTLLADSLPHVAGIVRRSFCQKALTQNCSVMMAGARLGGKYTWLNLKARNTVEMRLFNGFRNHTDILAALEYLHAVYTLTKPGAESNDATPEMLVARIKQDDTYSHAKKLLGEANDDLSEKLKQVHPFAPDPESVTPIGERAPKRIVVGKRRAGAPPRIHNAEPKYDKQERCERVMERWAMNFHDDVIPVPVQEGEV